MELMGTNRRRALRRRRKLMPEPRRVGAPAEQDQYPEGKSVLNDVPSSSMTPDLDQINQSGDDRLIVQN